MNSAFFQSSGAEGVALPEKLVYNKDGIIWNYLFSPMPKGESSVPQLPVAQEYVRIAPYTSMRVGGTVRYLYRPESEESFAALVRALSGASVPFLVIGCASNLLFPD